jgi:hypothetical protein
MSLTPRPPLRLEGGDRGEGQDLPPLPGRACGSGGRGGQGVRTLAAAALWLAMSAAAAPSLITRHGDAIEFPATVHAGAFSRRLFGMPGYHLIVWKDGRAAGEALFQAEVSDVEVLDALEALGARPGDNLPMATWDERKDAKSHAPDLVIAGPAVEILVRVPGRREPLGLDQILTDAEGKGFAMRFGGNRANIPQWHSGCIACLYSCPGSKVGNARATVRDYMRDPQRYQVRPGVLPEDGQRVTLVLRLAGKRSDT